MSALAHMLESAGIATSLVALVRLHAEKVRPPRALWVPFELGRPVGPPGEEAFHLRVMRAALDLLGRGDGPHLIEDFPEESPDANGEPGWTSPVASHPDDPVAELTGACEAHARWTRASGRTTVAVSGLEPRVALDYLQALARGESPAPPRADLHPAQLMRFAADDLKALYLEAACTGDGNPSGVQLRDWLWRETGLARLLHAVRGRCLDDADENLRMIGTGSLVPMEWR